MPSPLGPLCLRRAALLLAGCSLLFLVPASAQLAHRQAPLTVRVQTPAGAPLPGAVVKVEMLNPAFRFGTAVAAGKVETGNPGYDARTVENLQKYFNSITYENELKWSEFENRGATRVRQFVQNAYLLRAFNSADPMRQRGHATVWGAQAFVPANARTLTDATALRTRIHNHITAYHTALAGLGIDNYDLFNEPFSERTLIIDKLVPGSTRAQEAAELAQMFKRAKETDPTAQLFINEYNLLNFWQEDDARIRQFKELIDLIRDAGGPIDGIGLQGHMDRFITKAQITRRLNLLAAPMAPTANHPQGLPGLPIEVTELDINTQQWTTATPQQQAEVTANVLDAAFEHPSVQGVTIWVMNDGAHWRRNAIMFDDSNPTNWQLKPSGQVWIDRVKGTWWTNTSGLSSQSGVYSTPVFKGKHRITVEYEGTTQVLERNLTDATDLTVELSGEPVDTSQSRLVNMSVRTRLDANQQLTIGFVLRGEEMPVLIRAAGPALGAFGLSGMPDPRLEVFNAASTLVAANDRWPPSLAATFASAGAFAFPDASLDAALLAPLRGANTATVRGAQGGVVLVEAYERSTPGTKLINVSALNRVGTGSDVLIAGFVVGGTGKKRLLIRGVGPGLEQFGVGSRLADPQLQLYQLNNDGSSVLLESNNDWASALEPYFSQAGAFPIARNSRDAAMVVLLDAGRNYTAQVSGADGGTGMAIVEVYELP